jgi:hypothetical protein
MSSSALASAGMTFVLLEPVSPVNEIVLPRIAFQYTSLRIHSRARGSASAFRTSSSQSACRPE